MNLDKTFHFPTSVSFLLFPVSLKEHWIKCFCVPHVVLRHQWEITKNIHVVTQRMYLIRTSPQFEAEAFITSEYCFLTPAGTHCLKHGHRHTMAVCKFSPKWPPAASEPAISMPLLVSLSACLPLSPRKRACASFPVGLGSTFPLDVANQGPGCKRCLLYKLRSGEGARGLELIGICWTSVDQNQKSVPGNRLDMRDMAAEGPQPESPSDWGCGLDMITAWPSYVLALTHKLTCMLLFLLEICSSTYWPKSASTGTPALAWAQPGLLSAVYEFRLCDKYI